MDQEVTSTQVSSEPQQPQVETTTSTPVVEQASGQAAAVSAEAPAYTPNYKFRAADKDYEFEEWIRPVIKDAEIEKKLRDIHEKAYGLPVVKQRFSELEKTHKTTSSEYNTLKGDIKKLVEYRDTDIGKFFKTFQIDDEKIFQYAMDRLNYQQMPQEQRQVLEAQKAAEERAASLETKYQTQQEQFQQYLVTAKTSELKSALDRPDIKATAEAFDARVGKPGAFEAEVIRRGQLAAYAEGKDISALEAVQQVMSLIGQPATAQPSELRQTGKPPVIPAITGRSTSPAGKSPQSIEDLKKLARQRSS